MDKIIEIVLKTLDNIEIKTITFNFNNNTTINDIYSFIDNYTSHTRTNLIEIIVDGGLKHKLNIKNGNIKLTDIYENLFGDNIINPGDEIHIIYQELLPKLIKFNF